MGPQQALIIVDVQNDFCEGGALAVPGGNQVANNIEKYVNKVGFAYNVIAYTADWHRPLPDTNGGHFDEWPVHCVQNTHGAAFHEAIGRLAKGNEEIFRKGDGRPDYSGFQGVNSEGETLAEFLHSYNIHHLDIVGLAGDYCVRATAIDAVKEGFEPLILPGLVASIGGQPATFETVQMVEELLNQ